MRTLPRIWIDVVWIILLASSVCLNDYWSGWRPEYTGDREALEALCRYGADVRFYASAAGWSAWFLGAFGSFRIALWLNVVSGTAAGVWSGAVIAAAVCYGLWAGSFSHNPIGNVFDTLRRIETGECLEAHADDKQVCEAVYNRW